MRIGVVGVGGGGSALADALVADDAARADGYLAAAVALDTDAGALASLDGVAEDHRHLLGAVHVDGEGTAGDADLAAEIAREERPELRAAVDAVPVGSVDATLVCAALGGGTGAAVAPAVADLLDQLTGSPVYAVGVLPGTEEAGGDGGAVGVGDPARVKGGAGDGRGDEGAEADALDGPDRPLDSNAAGAVRALAAACDDLVLADLDVWRAAGAPYAAAWPRLDADVAARLGALFAAGEASDPVPERVLDASELGNTLGAGGVSVLGAAGTAVDNGRREGVVGGLLDRIAGADDPEVDEGEAVSAAANAARKAVTHRLSLACDPTSASRAAVVFHAPPAWLSRRGLERARGIVEDETGVPQIRWGDLPDPRADEFRVTVLLAGVTDCDRLDDLGDAIDPTRLG
ncbi:hypothetical protein [Halobaculum sp. EA56]|uniref:hypothetical protein n=1 Tax=Halobaculum sp. EA56 TaxID=3421648 RepID=UPI003EBCB522